MPELPEVETIKGDLQKKITGLKIKEIHVYDDRVLTQKAQDFVHVLGGKIIQEISRRSKALILKMDSTLFLVIHLKMTGQLIYSQTNFHENNSKETKIVFKLSNGWYLNYNDQRLFGRLGFVESLKQVPYFKNLGPEPLNGFFTVDEFYQKIKQRKAPIKTILMNQKVLAGIGNIYASEILFDAKINPKKFSKRLTFKEVERLLQSIRKVLEEAIYCRGTSMRNYRDAFGQEGLFINRIKVYDREGKVCVVCAKPIQRIIQVGRSTFYCANCQR